MPNVIIDTDIAIDFLRGKDYSKKLVLPLWENDSAFLSVLSIYEIKAGMKSNEIQPTNHFIHACNIININSIIAETGSQYYRAQRKKSLTLTTVDCLIYATAKVKHLKIATRNVKHYPDKGILLTF